MLGVEIDSERRENQIETDAQIVASNHCTLIMEPAPLSALERPPLWLVSIEVVLRDPVLGKDELRAMLPGTTVGPVLHRRQVVAVARYPSPVVRWVWFFQSSAGRARAKVWLHPGLSTGGECGITVLPTLAARGEPI